MPWTATDIDTLKAAIASGKGAQEVQFADQRVRFYSADDMLKLLAAMQADVTTTASHGSRTRYAATSKGV